MSMPLIEEVFLQPDSEDPRCGMVFMCIEHGEEPCGGRARWVATISCSVDGGSETILACDECHDRMEEGAADLACSRNAEPHEHRIAFRVL